MKLHNQVTSICTSLGIEPMNPSGDLYLPHLTLAGISWRKAQSIILPPEVEDLISMPLGPFHLALGEGDDIGQYLNTIYGDSLGHH